MSKHTPGPWYVDNPYRERGTYVSAKVDTSLVAKIYPQEHPGRRYKPDRSETPANARLIAAAPDLLEALESFLQWNATIEQWEDLERQAEAAIRKAKGE